MNSRILTKIVRMLAAVIACLAAASVVAQIPQTINYQGYLTDNLSKPVNAKVSVTFRLYTAASGGEPVWTETQTGIGVTNGIYNAVLGSFTAFGLSFFNVPYFLSLQVNSDAEMATRQPLSAVPYAHRAVTAETVAAGATIPATQLTGTIASSQFAATQLLPTTACTANQFSQWNGTAWICAAGTGTSTTSDVTGNLTMVNSTASAGNILKAGTLFMHNVGTSNAFLGANAGNLSMTGSFNTGVGSGALGQLGASSNNTAIGALALSLNGNGGGNTASGSRALQFNTTGSFNSAYGYTALNNNGGSGNTAVGYQALRENTTGYSNTAIGEGALTLSMTGANNIAIGSNAGIGIQTGSDNIVIGNVNGSAAADTGIIRIGTSGTQTKAFVAGIRGITPGLADALPVVIDSNGQLGMGASIGAFTNLTLPPSTATEGTIFKGSTPFIHNFGLRNTFIGESAGNFTMSGGNNSAYGWNALSGNTTGFYNTASGVNALAANTDGNSNTATGALALSGNTNGFYNTAIGVQALQDNSTGYYNTASGMNALRSNTIGNSNTANGLGALSGNTRGIENTASGVNALANNLGGSTNTANGVEALLSNTTGDNNTGIGNRALKANVTGYGNTAIGNAALYTNVSGFRNIAIGDLAGFSTTGNNNINIGNPGVTNENNTIRIGDYSRTRTFISGIAGSSTGVPNATPVLIDGVGQLGIANSSRRFKDNIADMDTASSALMQLRPVTFLYKTDQNPAGRTLQYGLIAEEVAEVYPGLVVHSVDGQIETVMYQHLPPMLLNEVQKQQRAIASLRAQLQTKDNEIDALKRDLDAIKKKLGLD